MDEIWIPIDSAALSDGTFKIDWHMDNSTYYKFLSTESSYIPINFTRHDHPGNYWYGDYGVFDAEGNIYPFLVNLNGKIYIYSYNESTHQWYINDTIELNKDLSQMEIEATDLNGDSLTDLILFNKKGDADIIEFYLYNEGTEDFDLTQTLNASSDINYPHIVEAPTFRDYILDFEDSSSHFTMYLLISNATLESHYITKLDFNWNLGYTQEQAATHLEQIETYKDLTELAITKESIFFSAVFDEIQIYIVQSIQSINNWKLRVLRYLRNKKKVKY